MAFEAALPPYNSSDPTATFLASSCLDFLLIELVPAAYRVTKELDERAAANAITAGGDEVNGPGVAGQQSAAGGGKAGNRDSLGAGKSGVGGDGSTTGGQHKSSAGGTARTATTMDEEEERDAVFYRLESLGYRVGQGLVERQVVTFKGLGFSRDRPKFNDTLDAIKFICKDLWTLAFRKQVDNLKTNHRGVYVLTDNSFRPFSRMSTAAGGQAALRAEPFLWFPCGIVRGALSGMGINATVNAETTELPGAVFQIKTITAPPA